jgi:hypothetical protein
LHEGGAFKVSAGSHFGERQVSSPWLKDSF